MPMDPAFWNGRRVLLTGHTGFKGAWLALWLQRMGAVVTGIALDPPSKPALYTLARVGQGMDSQRCDVRDAATLAARVRACRPEVVLHLAAQALVRPGYADPVGTWSTNVMGTVHLLEALRGLGCVRSVVVVTTDKVYRNHEWTYPYRETDALGGHDPYSASKAATELAVASYRQAFLDTEGVALSTARAGNVMGGGDWAQDRLLPDVVRAWAARQPLTIRHPEATRPWQHVLEPLAAYLQLAHIQWQDPARAGAYNFGPRPDEAASVECIVKMAVSALPELTVSYQNSSNRLHEARWLALETSCARQALGVVPRWPLAEAVQRTLHWYGAQHQGQDARALCDADFAAFEQAAQEAQPA